MRRTTIMAGSTVAALAAAGILAVSGGAEAPAGQTIKVVEKGGTEKFVDVAPRAKRGFDASAGDAFLFSSPLFDAANKRVGTLDVRCDFSKGGRPGRGICAGVFDLAGGDLILAARLTTSGTVTGAIIGRHRRLRRRAGNLHLRRPARRRQRPQRRHDHAAAVT